MQQDVKNTLPRVQSLLKSGGKAGLRATFFLLAAGVATLRSLRSVRRVLGLHGAESLDLVLE